MDQVAREGFKYDRLQASPHRTDTLCLRCVQTVVHCVCYTVLYCTVLTVVCRSPREGDVFPHQ